MINNKESKPKQLYKRGDNIAGYLFILPFIVGFMVFIFVPIIFSFILGFTKWNLLSGFGNIKFVGFKNFSKLLRDVAFTDSFKNTLIFAFFTISLQIVISLILASLLLSNIYYSDIFKTMIFVPYIASIVASAIVWQVMLNPTNGPVNQFLMSIGISNPPKWFVSAHWALPTLIAFTVWKALGYFTIVYIAGLKSIPEEIYEASIIDGASTRTRFFKITIPLVSPTTFFLFVTGLIGCFKAFDQIKVTTGGGPGHASSVLVLFVYQNAFEFYKMGYASAAAWILFLVIFAVTIFQWIGQKKWVNYE